MSPREAAASRDRSAEHAWNASKAIPGARGQATIAPQPLTDKQKAEGALQLAAHAAGAADLFELLALAGLDLSELRELRELRAVARTDRRTS